MGRVRLDMGTTKFAVGDRVRHDAHGEGEVKYTGVALSGEGEILVLVDFDDSALVPWQGVYTGLVRMGAHLS